MKEKKSPSSFLDLDIYQNTYLAAITAIKDILGYVCGYIEDVSKKFSLTMRTLYDILSLILRTDTDVESKGISNYE